MSPDDRQLAVDRDGELCELAVELAIAAEGRHDEVAERARALGGRLAAGQLHLAVLGEFKRGKSTFVNAVVGEQLLPTGVVPVTTVATLVSYGEPGAAVRYLDGSLEHLGAPSELADHVSEERNPQNVRQVGEVLVRARAPLLASGLVLVDTPGFGSAHSHNDEVAEKLMLEADGALLVLSADAPLSGLERDLLVRLAERDGPTYYVLNKVDHLTTQELGEVRRFVGDAAAATLGHPVQLWCVAALPALRAKLAGAAPGPESGEFTALEGELARFVAKDLVAEREAVARGELVRLARELIGWLDLAAAALAVDESVLAERVDCFRRAAVEERRLLGEEALRLTREVEALGEQIGSNLYTFAHEEDESWHGALEALALTAPRRGLRELLRRAVESAVRERFEPFRQHQAALAERCWRDLAERRRRDVERRVNDLRCQAAELFAIELPAAMVPEMSEERERFFYHFVDAGGQIDDSRSLLSWLLPPRLARRRLATRARARAAAEVDKHAGRARSDLVRRIDEVRKRFEHEVSRELEATVRSVLAAAEGAEGLQRQAAEDRNERLGRAAAPRRAAQAVLARASGEVRTLDAS